MIRTIIALIAFIAAGSIFFSYTQPAYDASGSVKGQIAQYDAALTKATELQKLKQQLLAQYNAFNPSDLDRLKKMLPDHVDNVRLILDLDNLAGSHGLALQNVVVSTPTNDQKNNTPASAISASKQGYDSLTLSFTTVATYDQFMQFLSDLQSSLRIVDVVSLKIAPVGPGKAGLYTFDITLRTYWLK